MMLMSVKAHVCCARADKLIRMMIVTVSSGRREFSRGLGGGGVEGREKHTHTGRQADRQTDRDRGWGGGGGGGGC